MRTDNLNVVHIGNLRAGLDVQPSALRHFIRFFAVSGPAFLAHRDPVQDDRLNPVDGVEHRVPSQARSPVNQAGRDTVAGRVPRG